MKQMQTLFLLALIVALGVGILTMNGCNWFTKSPKAVLAGPTETQFGDKAVYSSAGSTGTTTWIVSPECPYEVAVQTLTLTPPDVEEQFRIDLVATAGGKSDMATIKLVHKPKDGPEPPDPPNPTGLAEKATEAANRLVADATRKTVALKIAEVYDALPPGGFIGLQEAREKTRERVRAAIGIEAYAQWQPWFGEMGKAIAEQNVTTVRAWVLCCRELAKGLKEVK